MALLRPWDPYSGHRAPEVVPAPTEPASVPPAAIQAPKPAPKRRAPVRRRRVVVPGTQ